MSQWEGLSHIWWKINTCIKMFQTTNQVCVCVNEIAWIQNHQQPKPVHGSPRGTTGKSSIFVRENVWITVEIPPVKYRNWKQNEQNYGSLGPVGMKYYEIIHIGFAIFGHLCFPQAASHGRTSAKWQKMETLSRCHRPRIQWPKTSLFQDLSGITGIFIHVRGWKSWITKFDKNRICGSISTSDWRLSAFPFWFFGSAFASERVAAFCL